MNTNASSSTTTVRRIDENRPDWQIVARIERSRQAAWRQLNRAVDGWRRRESAGSTEPAR